MFVHPVYFGDDVVMSVSDAILPWFNQKTLIETMPQLGYDYTLETKVDEGSDTPLSRHIGEVTFLKRHFILYKSTGIVRMALAQESIENMPNFVSIGHPLGQATFDNSVAALVEAAFWGDDYFDDLRNRLITALTKQGLYGKYETETNFGHSRLELPRKASHVMWKVDRGQLPVEIKRYHSYIMDQVDELPYDETPTAWAVEAYKDFFKAWNKEEIRAPAIKDTSFALYPTETSLDAIRRFESIILTQEDGEYLRDVYTSAIPAELQYSFN
jgi:hypothetical protein